MKQLVLTTTLLLTVKCSLAAGLVGTTLGPVPGGGGSGILTTNFDTLTVTNALYLGSDYQSSPEIRIPSSGDLYFRNASGSELMRLEAGGNGNLFIYNNVYAGGGYFNGSVSASSVAVNNSITLGNNNTTLTAANYGSLSVGSGVASGAYSFACGETGLASGYASFAAGTSTATAVYSFACGDGNATGNYSAAFNNSTASGIGSFATGDSTVASGLASWSGGASATASHDVSFVWSDGTANGSTAMEQFSVFATGGIRLMRGVVQLGVGIASLATNAVNGAASGWTNSTGVDTTVAVSGVAVGFTLYNNAGTPIYTNAAGSTTFYPRVQAAGKIIVTAGTAVTLRALGY